MLEDLLKTGKPDDRELVEDAQQVGSERLGRPDPTGLKGSRHARLSDHIRAPEDDLDLDEAETLCGQVTRAWLRDFAPALMLLDVESRRRLQAALTLTRTAIDFALQPGVEGERVSALNRLQFEVEAALDGDPRGQPAHLLIAAEQDTRAWDRTAWDALFDRLRHLAMIGAWDAAQVRAVALAIAGVVDEDSAEALGAALATVLSRIEGWRASPAPTPSPPPGRSPTTHNPQPTTHNREGRGWLRFASYVRAAERRLRRREAQGRSVKLGLPARVWLLLRARLA